MRLGYTLPLQRFLRTRAPVALPGEDLRLCWELHLLRPGGAPSLFAVHASSRFALLLCGLDSGQWAELPVLFCRVLGRCLEEEGYTDREVAAYLRLAGETVVTGTHGRRPVAFLNRAVEDLTALPFAPEPDGREQPPVRESLNRLIRRTAGHEAPGRPRELLRRDLERLLGESGA